MKKDDDNEILRYLESHGIEDKDLSCPPSMPKKNIAPIKKPIDAPGRKTLDLHGRTQEQAAIILRNAISFCKENHIHSLLIIHGKGNNSDPNDGPVLRELVRNLLRTAYSHCVEDFTSALPREGGEGATMVKLFFNVEKT